MTRDLFRGTKQFHPFSEDSCDIILFEFTVVRLFNQSISYNKTTVHIYLISVKSIY